MDNTLYALTKKNYLPGITLITPTGDRHEAFERCEFYVKRQTYTGSLQWIVADDGREPTKCVLGQHYIRNKPQDKHACCPGVHKAYSFTGNVLSMLEYVEYDKIIVIEDDDWYHPTYVKETETRLNTWHLTGEAYARYYNVNTRQYRLNGNTRSASFCQTALHCSVLGKLYESCLRRQSAFIDTRLWEKAVFKKVTQETNLCVGIKGMPGRRGIGMGHRPDNAAGFKNDPEMKRLIEWIGVEDANYYAKFYEPRIKNKKR